MAELASAAADAARLTPRAQRSLIDAHLELSSAAGISSAMFLPDSEVGGGYGSEGTVARVR